jgi:hypothetical protein
MTPRILRAMVIAWWVVLVASYLLVDLIAGAERHLTRLEAYDGYGAILHGQVFFVLPLVVGTFACVGVFFLQNWGRYLYLAGSAYLVATSLLFGYRVSTPFESFLGSLSGLLEGAILTVCFLMPYRQWFERPAVAH